MECRVWSGECGVESVESGVWSGECELWSVKIGMLRVEWRV